MGSYDVTLTVTDNDGATGTDSVTISVAEEGSSTPEANIGTVSESYDEWLRLDASESSDPDGGSLTYQWEISAGSFYRSDGDTAEQPWVNVEGVDSVTATLTVTDTGGLSDTAERTLDV